MKHMIYVAAVAIGFLTVSGSPASARNYDCSKAGNANKAVCKTTTKATTATPVSVPARAAAKPAATMKTPSASGAMATAQRNYDCSKAGNKNKAVCKTAAVLPSKPVVTATAASSSVRNYDCSKAGNATKQVCKTAAISTPPASVRRAPSPVVPVRAAPAPQVAHAPASQVTNSSAAGASAACKDGSFSHAKVHTGACSRHGGVAKWL